MATQTMTAPAESRFAELIAEHHATYGEEKGLLARMHQLAARRGDEKIRKSDVERAFREQEQGGRYFINAVSNARSSDAS